MYIHKHGIINDLWSFDAELLDTTGKPLIFIINSYRNKLILIEIYYYLCN